jgi:hypothetical protein
MKIFIMAVAENGVKMNLLSTTFAKLPMGIQLPA